MQTCKRFYWHNSATFQQRQFVLVMLAALLAGAVFLAPPSRSQNAATAAQPGLFETVRPILHSCVPCHAGASAGGGLDLTSRTALLKGGASGPATIPGDAKNSLLLRAVRHQGRQMPPQGKLSPAKIAARARWVEQGAPWKVANDQAAAPTNAAAASHGPPQMDARAKRFWSFRKVTRPAVPRVQNASWARNSLDHFVLATLEKNGLKPAPFADRTTLIRRAFYDLTGLPPTPAQVQAFVADPSPAAWEKVVNDLLAAPQYGERWGRHWLDLVRYAETNSFEHDNDKPWAWRYRDWVIRAFNQDMPYNRFVHAQLAGDELPRATPDTLIATGYYRLGPLDDEPADPEQARFDDLDDLVSTTSQTFLGLTVGCARCHDHKIDPVPQKDYYRLLAFFRNVKQIGAIEDVVRPDLGGGERDDFKNEANRAPILEKRVPQLLSADRFAEYKTLLAARAALRAAPPRGLEKALCGQFHFGRGIVRTPSNFGFLGVPPTHPALLDFLASELVRNGWRLKPLHRQILLSSTYQMASTPSKTALARDPENDLFSHFNRRRLDAEEIRDSILAASGNLNCKRFGPSVLVTLPREVLAGQSIPGAGWGESSPAEQARRSVYVKVKRSLAVPILARFDGAETDATCPVRFATTQPTQALGMMNSAFVSEQAAQVRLALWRATQRAPTANETARGVALLRDLRDKDHKTDDQALAAFCLVALNLNEFIYLD